MLLTIVAEVNVPLILTESLICIALESADDISFVMIVVAVNVLITCNESFTMTLPVPDVLKYKLSLLRFAAMVEFLTTNPPR